MTRKSAFKVIVFKFKKILLCCSRLLDLRESNHQCSVDFFVHFNWICIIKSHSSELRIISEASQTHVKLMSSAQASSLNPISESPLSSRGGYLHWSHNWFWFNLLLSYQQFDFVFFMHHDYCPCFLPLASTIRHIKEHSCTALFPTICPYTPEDTQTLPYTFPKILTPLLFRFTIR